MVHCWRGRRDVPRGDPPKSGNQKMIMLADAFCGPPLSQFTEMSQIVSVSRAGMKTWKLV
jgi:hypothetical protein